MRMVTSHYLLVDVIRDDLVFRGVFAAAADAEEERIIIIIFIG